MSGRTTLQLAEKVLLCAFNGPTGVRQAVQASDTLVIPEAFIDALSYLCSRVKHTHVQSQSTCGDPLRVYLRQTPSFRAAYTHKDVRAALNGPLAESCSPTLTLFGLVTTICGPQWQDSQPRKSHVHLVTVIGLRMVEAKGDTVPTRTVEAAVPCVLQDQNNPIQLGSHCELVTCPSVQFTAPCGFLNYHFTVSNAQRASVAHLRARQLQCPLQQPMDVLFRPPLGKLMRLLRAATGVVGPGQREQVTWYMLLCALLSAVAVGEEQRTSKIDGRSRQRCQIHVLLAGEMLDPGVEMFFESAAEVLSPVVSSTKLRAPLHPTTVKRANNMQQCTAGTILEASQGICLVNLAKVQMSQDDLGHLWRAFIHETGSVAKMKDAAKSDTFLNTSTFWLKVDVEHRATKCGSTVEALHKAIGSNLVNAADLIVLGGDSDVRTEVTVDRVLGLADWDEELDTAGSQDAAAAAEKAQATLDLRQHLLQACKLQAPTMSKETSDILQEYYTACRGIDTQGQGLSTVLVTLLRLSFASARLHLRETCDAVDCLLAIRLVEESRINQHHISVLEVQDLNQAPVADAAGSDNSFTLYLEGLRRKYAPQMMLMNEE